MKKLLLTGMLLIAMAVIAEAQGTGGYGYGYRSGRGGSTGYGYRSGLTQSGYGYRSGFGIPSGGGGLYFGHGPLYYGAHPPFPRYYNYSGPFYPGYLGGGFHSYGSDFGYYPPYGLGGEGAYGYPAYKRAYQAAGLDSDYNPGWASKRGVADRANEFAASREIDGGRRLLRAARYSEALNRFRAAVLAHTDSGGVQAWFAIGLAASGDAPNAEKALRAAAKAGAVGKLPLSGLFKDVKEEAKLLDRFGAGTLVGAWLRFLKGDAAPLKKLGEKVPDALKLLQG